MTNKDGVAERAADGPSVPAPVWKKGDTWQVHYRTLTYAIVGYADAPVQHDEVDWVYVVEEVSSEGVTRISARPVIEGKYPRQWSLEFSREGRLVRYRTAKGGEHDLDGGPFLPERYASLDGLALAWPAFPLHPGKVETFENGELTQTVSEDRGVVTIARKAMDGPSYRERNAVQHWEPGRPWWSTVSVDTKALFEGRTFETLDVVGSVTSWGPVKGE